LSLAVDSVLVASGHKKWLSAKQRLRILLRNAKKFEVGPARTTSSLLPTPHRVRAHIEEPHKKHLARIKRAPVFAVSRNAKSGTTSRRLFPAEVQLGILLP